MEEQRGEEEKNGKGRRGEKNKAHDDAVANGDDLSKFADDFQDSFRISLRDFCMPD